MGRFRYAAVVATITVALIGAMWWFMRAERVELPAIGTVPPATAATTGTTVAELSAFEEFAGTLASILSTPTHERDGTHETQLADAFGVGNVSGAFDELGRPAGPTSVNTAGGWCVLWAFDDTANPVGYTLSEGVCRTELTDDDPDNDAVPTTQGGILVPGG